MTDSQLQNHYQKLQEKWKGKQIIAHKKLLSSNRDITSSLQNHLIGTLMLAATPFINVLPAPTPQPTQIQYLLPITHTSATELSKELKEKLPENVRPLTQDEEKQITDIIASDVGIEVSGEFSGIRLDRNYGLIGKEQHLRRFPGDNIDTHFASADEASLYASDGTAPGLGAWGYFSSSKETFTEQDALREKYYIAVPTFLAPGFDSHVGEYGLFFKYRKMLVINPDNGKTIVADIADAGPSAWTGKNLGGSPEVMHYLERVDGAQRGPVLYFFINDPNDKIPLGPVYL